MLDKLCCLSKDLKIIGRTSTGILSEKPCKVYKIYISPLYLSAFYCEVFNGLSDSDEKIITIPVLAVRTTFIEIAVPILFSKGIYIKASEVFLRAMFHVKELY